MPDITMCLASDCKIKNSCYRHTAKPDRYQSYSDYSSFCNKSKNGNKSYSYYMSNERG